MKDEEWESLYLYAKSLVDAHKNFDEIKIKLNQKTNDQMMVAEIITQIKKVQQAVKTKIGVTKIGFGVLFLFIGFLITFINFHNN